MYTAPVDGSIVVSSCDQSTDTFLEIYRFPGSISNCNLNEAELSLLNDDYSGPVACSTYGSYLELDLDTEDHILILWKDNYSSSPFDFEVIWTCDDINECLF